MNAWRMATLTIALALAAAVACGGCWKKSIQGRVVDEAGAGVAGAEVSIEGTEFKATTGADGGFALPWAREKVGLAVTALPQGYIAVEGSDRADFNPSIEAKQTPALSVARMPDYAAGADHMTKDGALFWGKGLVGVRVKADWGEMLVALAAPSAARMVSDAVLAACPASSPRKGMRWCMATTDAAEVLSAQVPDEHRAALLGLVRARLGGTYWMLWPADARCDGPIGTATMMPVLGTLGEKTNVTSRDSRESDQALALCALVTAESCPKPFGQGEIVCGD
jgi:hypothetical protein